MTTPTFRTNFPTRWIAIIAPMILLFAIGASAQTTEPLIEQANLVYVGAFRLPAGTTDQTSFNYGGTALTYDAADNSLFIVGHPNYQYSAEVSIPAIVNSANINDLNTATLIQPFADPLAGQINTVDPAETNAKKIGGELVYGNALIVSVYSYYDANGTQSTSHFVRPLTLSTTGQVRGPFRVGSQYPGFVSGYMALIPPDWRQLFGGPALTGNCCLNIISLQSNGPAASVFDPALLGTTNPLPAIPVVGYPHAYPLGPGGTTQNSIFNWSTKITGIVFPIGTRSVLFFGHQGTGPFCYGIGASTSPLPVHECYDPTGSSKGVHAYPYVYQVWAYDANDLVSVKEGRKEQYQIQPYAIWSFILPIPDLTGQHLIGGAAYDPQTNRIYISQQCVGTNCEPIINVFQVNGLPPIPMAPSRLQVQ